jgi:O-antigen/teichoic acid export membrane protein
MLIKTYFKNWFPMRRDSNSNASNLSLRKIFGLSSVYGITPILDKALALLLLPVFTRYLSTDGYGSMVLLYTSATILQLLLFLGFPDSLQKIYWDFKDEERRNLLGTAWISNLAFNLLLAIPLIIFSGNITATILKNEKIGFLFVLIIVKILLSTQTIVPFVILRAREQKFEILKVNLISIFVRVGLTLLFLIYLKLNLVGIFLADIGTSIAIQFVYLPILVREVSFKFKWIYLKEILSLSPFQFSVEILAWIISLSDRMIIQQMLNNPSEVAIYAVGYTFGSAIIFLVNPLLAAWRPYVYSVYSDGVKNYSKQMGEFLFYFVVICCASFLILATVCPNLIKILTPSVYHRAISLVGIVLIAQVMATISNYFLPTFFIVKKVQVVAIVYAICAVANVGFNLILIPIMGIMGAAVATLISYGIMAGALYIESQRLVRIAINLRAIFITAIITAATWYLLSKVEVVNPWVSLTVKTLILAPGLMVSAAWLYRQRKSGPLMANNL